jgi:hypothetical protein
MASTILPRSSEVILDTGLQYYVENLTDSRLTTGDGKTDLLRFNKIAYRCESGEKVIVPWPVIALYFGDPRSQHERTVEATDSQGVHMVPARGNELMRLSVFYGVYEQGVETIAAVVPRVRITTLDGIEIVPPCFDPDADHIYGFERNMQKTGDVATLIENLQSQIDSLKQAQAQRHLLGDNDNELPEDIPRQPWS